MPVAVTVKLQGLREAQAQFSKLGYELKNFPAEMKAIGTAVSKYYKEDVFDTQGAALGARWKERKPQYRKGTRIDTWPILLKSTHMQSAWDYKAERTRVEIFNPTKYAVYHQEGRGYNPVRLLMKVTEPLRDKVEKIFKDMIKAKINRIFGRA